MAIIAPSSKETGGPVVRLYIKMIRLDFCEWEYLP